MEVKRYWKVYEVWAGRREYCGIFRAPDAQEAVLACHEHYEQRELRALRPTLEAEETTDERLFHLAVGGP